STYRKFRRLIWCLESCRWLAPKLLERIPLFWSLLAKAYTETHQWQKAKQARKKEIQRLIDLWNKSDQPWSALKKQRKQRVRKLMLQIRIPLRKYTPYFSSFFRNVFGNKLYTSLYRYRYRTRRRRQKRQMLPRLPHTTQRLHQLLRENNAIRPYTERLWKATRHPQHPKRRRKLLRRLLWDLYLLSWKRGEETDLNKFTTLTQSMIRAQSRTSAFPFRSIYAELLSEQGKLQQALSVLKDATTTGTLPTLLLLWQRAELYRRTLNFAQATQTYRILFAKYRQKSAALYQAKTASIQKQQQIAEEAYRKYVRATFSTKKNRRSTALSRTQRYTHKIEEELRMANTFLQSKQPQKVQQTLAVVFQNLQRSPTATPRYRAQLQRALFLLQDLGTLETSLRTWKQQWKQNPNHRHLLLKIYYASTLLQYPADKQLIREILRLWPDLPLRFVPMPLQQLFTPKQAQRFLITLRKAQKTYNLLHWTPLRIALHFQQPKDIQFWSEHLRQRIANRTPLKRKITQFTTLLEVLLKGTSSKAQLTQVQRTLDAIRRAFSVQKLYRMWPLLKRISTTLRNHQHPQEALQLLQKVKMFSKRSTRYYTFKRVLRLAELAHIHKQLNNRTNLDKVHARLFDFLQNPSNTTYTRCLQILFQRQTPLWAELFLFRRKLFRRN
ncbi:MAG: hypothetical protein AAGJ35_06435, partial [Myxococcota bacterium]